MVTAVSGSCGWLHLEGRLGEHTLNAPKTHDLAVCRVVRASDGPHITVLTSLTARGADRSPVAVGLRVVTVFPCHVLYLH